MRLLQGYDLDVRMEINRCRHNAHKAFSNIHSYPYWDDEIWFSYDEPIAVYRSGMGLFVTKQYFSNTTQKHKTKIANHLGMAAKMVEEEDFKAILSKVVRKGRDK